MNHSDYDASTTSRDTSWTNTVSGLLTLSIASLIGFIAVIAGEHLAYTQVTSPAIGGELWPVSVGAIIAFSILASLFIMFLALALIESIDDPVIYGKPAYPLICIGGLIGVAVGVCLSLGVWAGAVVSGDLPSGVGKSLPVIASVAVPLAFLFHQVYSGDKAARRARHSSGGQLDPSVVREQSTKVSTSSQTPHRTNAGQGESLPKEDAGQDVGAGDPTVGASSNGEGSLFDEMEYRWDTETDVTFDDVGGMESLKQQLQRDVIAPLKTHRDKADELGVSAPNIVFHGPPGTGKTYMAQALASELGLPFAQLSGSDVQSKWINESATKVNALFEEAKAVAEESGGAVVFLDELDSVLKERSGAGSSHEEDNKVVNEFLNHLENTEEHNIVFIGATNRLESLDEAGIRSGRIDKKIHVGEPDLEAREAVLRAQLGDRPHDLSDGEIKQIAESASGFVAADIEAVVESAAKNVLSRGGNAIQMRDLERGLSDVA